ncbi:MAG: bifunctional molybdenum cofactor biosynthesis protein MoaC/MoaB [Fimbriimonadaceae bacterium]|nr:bifunctional molybdenum cofactor biosynthesis protein MoaC/MoaB [Fimbriimonadaceae bacterium]
MRTATAKAVITVSPETITIIRQGKVPKGDPIPVSKVAAIQAVKNTPLILPYCHPIPVDGIGVDLEIKEDRIEVTVSVRAIYKTGVEMEALTGASAAVLNIYDMLKMLDDTMEIDSVRLVEKTGGKSNFAHGLAGAFHSAVIVVSDSASKGEREDTSGAILKAGLEEFGAQGVGLVILPDDPEALQNQVRKLADDDGIDLILLTGGTGIGPRDLTPEAILPLLDKRIEGIEEHFQSYSRQRTPFAMFSRTVAGQRGCTLILALPGSPGACRDALDSLFPYVKHYLSMREGASHG